MARGQPSTFSIVAADPATGEVGVAVQSKYFAVGAVVPWAKAGVGAVATQAAGIAGYGPGNILAGEDVVREMARAFRETEGEIAELLVAALEAGQAAGGDRRGHTTSPATRAWPGAGRTRSDTCGRRSSSTAR